MGIIALLLLTQAVVPQKQREDKQEQSSSEESEQQQVFNTIAIPFSSFQVNLDYQSYLLREIFVENNRQSKFKNKGNLFFPTQKILRTILRQIISPNAP